MPAPLIQHRRRTPEIFASQTTSSIPPPPVDPPPDGTPSGVVMPATPVDPAFPTRIFGQDFKTDCGRGEFLAAYFGAGTFNAANAAAGNGLVSAYPTSYGDTRSKGTPVDGHYGVYDPANIRCSGGSMFNHIWWKASLGTSGNMSVCAPVPLLSSTGWGYVGSSRRSVRCRVVIATTRATTKVAWLGWPLNNHSTTVATAGIPDSTSSTGFRGGDGEWDWPEQDGSSAATWFMHKQNAKSTDTSSTPIYGTKQTSSTSTVDFYDGNWHTWTSDRVVGSYNTGTSSWVGQVGKFYVDGVQIGSTQVSRVPMTPMRWVLQTETTLSSSTPLDQTVDYEVEVDWMTVDTP